MGGRLRDTSREELDVGGNFGAEKSRGRLRAFTRKKEKAPTSVGRERFWALDGGKNSGGKLAGVRGEVVEKGPLV